MRDFEELKRRALARLERAVYQGEVDSGVLSLVSLLNRCPDYYTTSSCAGRIVVSQASSENLKSSYRFLGKWHRVVSAFEVMEAMGKHDAEVLYFRVDPLIFHVGARDGASADILLSLCRKTGLKRSGIIQLTPRVIVEILGVDSLQAPLGFEGELLVDEAYVKQITALGNEKYKHNQVKLKALTRLVREALNDAI
jgi:tRNA wybutosine-synthesizing protein 3